MAAKKSAGAFAACIPDGQHAAQQIAACSTAIAASSRKRPR